MLQLQLRVQWCANTVGWTDVALKQRYAVTAINSSSVNFAAFASAKVAEHLLKCVRCYCYASSTCCIVLKSLTHFDLLQAFLCDSLLVWLILTLFFQNKRKLFFSALGGPSITAFHVPRLNRREHFLSFQMSGIHHQAHSHAAVLLCATRGPPAPVVPRIFLIVIN